ncbi:hypothetical protein [Bremerella cremea]|uniref:hypothetical protein n=1 Tax=Bremerella cremea TaxID=1031537 RepID=UPI0031ED398F
MTFWCKMALLLVVHCGWVTLFVGCDGCDSKTSIGAFSGPATEADGSNRFIDGPELDQLTQEYADIAFFEMTHESYRMIKQELSKQYTEMDTNLSVIRIERSKGDHIIATVGTVTASAAGKEPWEVSFDIRFLRTMEHDSVSHRCIYAKIGDDLLLDRRNDPLVVKTLSGIGSSQGND